jgi:catechol 2,3-dioxygenase-like lactoylglutathione lyase family enzyme
MWHHVLELVVEFDRERHKGLGQERGQLKATGHPNDVSWGPGVSGIVRLRYMPTTINHVSVNAVDLQQSVDFYVELLGAELIPTPNFGLPVQWLALGRTQLHLFERDIQPTSHHHLGITVDDLEPVYRVAEKHGALDRTAFRNHLVELPGDVVQLYIRDPAGNLVEIDQHGVDRLPDDIRAQLKGLWELNPQSEDNMRGRLFVPD